MAAFSTAKWQSERKEEGCCCWQTEPKENWNKEKRFSFKHKVCHCQSFLFLSLLFSRGKKVMWKLLKQLINFNQDHPDNLMVDYLLRFLLVLPNRHWSLTVMVIHWITSICHQRSINSKYSVIGYRLRFELSNLLNQSETLEDIQIYKATFQKSHLFAKLWRKSRL